LKALFRRSARSSLWNNQHAIREELFSVERLEAHGRTLAAAQAVAAKPVRGHPLAGRLADNASVLLKSHAAIARVADQGGAITPAALWLLDNYYLIERQIHDIRLNLPPGYYRQLPKLTEGPFTGYPRVLGVAWAFVAHTDSRFDPEILCRYVRAYQDVVPLTIGELWALAITLRIVLIENLRRLAETIVNDHALRQQADRLADQLLAAGSGAAAMPDRMPLRDAFAVQLVYRLRDQDPKVTPALTWLDQRLATRGTTADAIVRDELQRQGAASVTVQNIITSMRLISDVEWTELVERISLVDDVLAAGSDFAAMDFPTRNLYRSAIEDLARGCDRTEIEIARSAVTAAQLGAAESREHDPGYHLLAGGRLAFEASIGFHAPLRTWPRRANNRLGISGYLTAIGGVTAVLLALTLLVTGLGPAWIVLGLIPLAELAVAIVNRTVIWGFGATLLPALDLSDGVPAELRTLVAVPMLLTTTDEIDQQIKCLEVHHLASPGGELHFALLSDWADAATETTDSDAALLKAATDGIVRLNQQYGEHFQLLHRRRVWNAGEGCWLGWERKRGKLHELNRLLRGATDTTFITDGVPAGVRYVVTLDADTRLPRDTVRRLIGKMAHPLNKPRLDSGLGRVVEGHAVMQPRVTPSLPVGLEGSFFQRTFSSVSGIDPYSAAVSDVYQDLFDEGSYAGKGIYDVDAFAAALAGRVPDSTLLSHDLFEGVFARAALASDIEVVEAFPARYDAEALRQHRWARGDWQLLPWILGLRPLQGSIPPIGRWKMLDNLRRTLVAPATVVALLIGFTLPVHTAIAWTGFILLTILLPPLIPVVSALLPSRSGVTADSHLRALGGDLSVALTSSALRVVFLPDHAWLMADAIGRTLIRLFVSHRHMLEWVTAAQATIGPRRLYWRMVAAPVAGAAALAVGCGFGHATWPLAGAFAAAWIASPLIARRISESPLSAGRMPVSIADAQTLRLTARRTWRFFEQFVTPADNMLPPDNFQEDPEPAVAHRTSPTNIGLYLLSAVTARDFGWVGTTETIERLEATVATMGGLIRSHGHFFNWYDTQTLRPLEPRYISSVDSGNLAGHLIALANACEEWCGRTLAGATRLAGIADALVLVRQEASRLDDGIRTEIATWQQLDSAIAALVADTEQPPLDRQSLDHRLADLALKSDTMTDIARALATERGDSVDTDMVFWAEATRRSIASHRRDIANPASQHRLSALAKTARAMALGMEFGFLFNQQRKLLSIGYLVADDAIDPSCYDLLASEARLASFVAIAKGDIPSRHWFRLGRSVTPVGRGAALISWSGSMFEYLMPALVMRAPAGSLLEQTSRLIVRRQIDFANTLGLPWGISESAYNARDLEFTYQYSNFGVPGLGLKRGLGSNAVIAPYASALATMVDPRAAAQNFGRLTETGARGRYGFYEALDYTPVRVPEGKTVAVVQAYMAHHQGMTIVAIADALLNGLMRARFHAEPIVQATELLLQERPPRDIMVARPFAAEAKSAARVLEIEPPGSRRLASPHGATPATHLLSNGEYAVMLTAAGSGYSRWRDLAVTRWREDTTCDDWGSYVYLRDTASGTVWSAGFQPSGAVPDSYEVVFKEDRAEFTRRDGTLTTAMDVLVSPEGAAEVRRVCVTNAGPRARVIDLTSYAELTLGPQAADVAHPAFGKLFVETSYLADIGVILATRRRRTPNEPEIWAAHLAVVEGEALGKPEIETDRSRFLGRGHGVRDPVAAIDGRRLSDTVGTVLDPVFALRRRVRIAPGTTVRVTFWTMVASSREAVLDLADTHRNTAAFERAASLAWTQAQVQLHHLGINPNEASLFQRLAGHLVFAAPTLRPSSDTIRRGSGGQPDLWTMGISGDLPVVLLRVAGTENLDIVRQLLQAHEYWRMKQLAVDIVILNEHAASYVQDLQVALETLLRSSQSRPQIRAEGPSGQVYILRADLITPETRTLLASIARVVLVGQRGRISDQLDRAPEATSMPLPAPLAGTPLPGTPRRPMSRGAAVVPPLPELEFFNGLGGFADNGREYVTVMGPGQSTPAPWINVVANPAFGFQVAAEGGGYTWSVNSRENQITPWANDPVSDRSGEVFYLRDDDTGELWNPTAQPIRDPAQTYVARHGRGYSRFQHTAHEIAVDLIQYVPLEDPIKISRLTLQNLTDRARRVSVTAYVEWVLGPSRTQSASFVTTEIDPATGAMFARNQWQPSFASRIAFIDLAGRQKDWTGDRREFIGRNGTLANPAGLLRANRLSNTVGAGLDPCGAMRTSIELPANSVVEIICFLGQADSAEDARVLIKRYRDADLNAVRTAVRNFWDDALGRVQVKTPDRPMDIMLNGWLLYQTLACRVWARSAFYQASGAYGFRDQLQDNMALATVRPAMTRAHLLRAAARQFVEGDMQHWWLPHSGQGVRTRISDDRVWLAYAVAHYVDTVGDAAVLDEPVALLEGPMLDAGVHDNFFNPTVSDQTATLFEHCARALDQSLAVGSHGLPLIGTGDWNDGMNRVGEAGRGESVWLGWFLSATIDGFARLAEIRNETNRAANWRAHAAALAVALEREAWDGDWYRRGFYDDGTPLGSAASEECRIDSIAQSWAVLSGVAHPERARQGMAEVERQLIRHGDGVALLFAPPFDKTALDPGYIKGYPPGIRENGGQYTHAALWSVMAFASLGDGDTAAALFSLLNPINHASTRAGVYRYKVEPYVIAADVYAVPPHVGRGGWTWYTGSAGWMYRAGLESVLGLRLHADLLSFDPCIPRTWPGFTISLRHGSARYEIKLENPDGISRGIEVATIDGEIIVDRPLSLTLADDAVTHRLVVRLGQSTSPPVAPRPGQASVPTGQKPVA
jgi:cyclic beta-1,2-glucan synthetase